MGKLDGKVALITGGANGQGAAESRRFVDEGAKVVVADVDDDRGKVLADELGEAAVYVHQDVTSEEDWESAIRTTDEAFGRLDVLLNNAGILKFSPLAATSLEDYMQVIDVNQVGVFLGMRSVVAPLMKAGGGSIVNVSSVEGMFGGPYLVAYTASKFAVRGMTKVAAVELGQFGIRVNSIHPGTIDTPMLDIPGVDREDMKKAFGRVVPLGRMGTPEDIAGLCLFLASDDSSYISGGEFLIDGGASAYIRWPGLSAHPAGR
jgi:3alpha(or 20beta)-hydroxysteroid dehydrogenase